MHGKLSDQVVWHRGQVAKTERESRFGQRAVTLWLTGLSASGKSTLAFALERALIDQGRACYVLDGDNVRHGLNQDLGFSAVDRAENIRRIAEVAKLMNDAGLIVITAFISPFGTDRTRAREIIGNAHYCEIYLETPLVICESRDPKGMYKLARAGRLADFTGISSPYEIPDTPHLTLDTNIHQPDELVALVLESLQAFVSAAPGAACTGLDPEPSTSSSPASPDASGSEN